MGFLFFIALLALLAGLAYHRASLMLTTACSLAYLILLSATGGFGFFTLLFVWLVFVAVLVPLNVPDLRRNYIIKPLYDYAGKMLPTLSETEEEALQAGSVNWDGELFSGAPNWKEFLSHSAASLSRLKSWPA
jgi:acyl-CoA dehydrogenase